MRAVDELDFGEIYINRTLGESVHAHHAGYKESGDRRRGRQVGPAALHADQDRLPPPWLSRARGAPRALLLDPADNVAVAVAALEPGEAVAVDGAAALAQPVRFGHKLARRDIAAGEAMSSTTR